MTNAPERIWAGRWPSGGRAWREAPTDHIKTGYIRADLVEAMEAENQRLTRLALKAFTVVEWVAGDGFLLPDPHYDADDLLLEMARALGVEDSVAARAALRSTEASHDD